MLTKLSIRMFFRYYRMFIFRGRNDRLQTGYEICDVGFYCPTPVSALTTMEEAPFIMSLFMLILDILICGLLVLYRQAAFHVQRDTFALTR